MPSACGELAEEVFVDAAERVAGLAAVALEADVGDQVDEPLHLDRLDAAAGVVARELALEVRVVALDGKDGVVDQRGDVGTGGLVLEVRPAGFGRHPEDALGRVLVAAFEQAFELLALDAVLFQFVFELVAPGLEGVGDVLQEEQAEDDVLVFRGIDGAPELVGGLPECVGVVEIGGIIGGIRHGWVSPDRQGSLCPDERNDTRGFRDWPRSFERRKAGRDWEIGR